MAESPRLSWRQRKQIKKLATWTALALSATLLVPLAAYLSPSLARLVDQLVSPEMVASLLSPIGFMLDAPVIRDLLNAHPEALHALVGFGFGNLAAGMLAGRIQERFFESFNDDVLTPVANLNRPDREEGQEEQFVELAWQEGEPGSDRRRSWGELVGWHESLTHPTKTDAAAQRLSIVVLAGRAGSGKSRMAYELAGRLVQGAWMAQSPWMGMQRQQQSFVSRIGSYLRTTVPGLRRRATDRWDAALLKTGGAVRDLDELCARLRRWRPRRPTLLILDDPPRGWTDEIWTALTEADRDKPFAYPVSLLIANQTVPAEAGFIYAPAEQRWLRDKVAARPQPILLPVTAWFTERETIRIGLASGRVLGDLARERAVREKLYLITEGNPLLVQLAAEWLRDGKPLDQMATQTLTAARAARIINALRLRHVDDPSQLAALAIATLLGGVRRRGLESVIATIFPLPKPLPALADLQACFPTEPLERGGAMLVPGARPDLVADAFIDRVLGEIGTDHATLLVEAAFRADAATMLRSLRRARTPGSPMAAALRDVDPARIAGMDPVAFALAVADVATVCHPDDRPLSTQETRRAATDVALRRIEGLTPEQCGAFCRGFATICDIAPTEWRQRQVRLDVAMALMDAGARNAREPVPSGIWLRFFRSHAFRIWSEPDDLQGMVRSAQAIDTDAAAEDFANAVWLVSHVLRPCLSPVFRVLAVGVASRGAGGKAAKLLAMSAVAMPEAAASAADDASAYAKSRSGDVAAWHDAAAARYFEAYAWGEVPTGLEATSARAAADAVQEIALRFSDDETIQEDAAATRRSEAYAWSEVSAGAGAPSARAAADAVRDIALRFSSNEVIQDNAARARRHEAHAWSQLPEGAGAISVRAAVEAVRDIVSRFADSAFLQIIYAIALCSEAHAWSLIPAGVRAASSRTAAAAAWDIAQRFPDCEVFQFAYATARCSEAYAWSEAPAGTGAASSRSAAEAIRDIAMQFPDSEEFQSAAAQARRHEAYAWSRIPNGAGAEASRAAASAAEEIARRFPLNENIQSQAAKAGFCEAYAWSEVPAGARASASHAAANAVRDIAMRFPDSEELQSAAAQARRHEAYGWSQIPNGAGAEASRAAADAAREIARRFPLSETIQDQASRAGCCEAYAWSEVPKGARASTSHDAANAISDIARQFPHNETIQEMAVQARRHEAYAWSQIPQGAGAKASRTAAEVAREIARRFPLSETMQDQAAWAGCSEAYAWSEIPAGARADASHAAANTVEEISRRFPNNGTIQSAAASARRHEAYAWSRIPNGAGAEASRAAADAIREIAQRFPHREGIQDDLALAQRFTERARGNKPL